MSARKLEDETEDFASTLPSASYHAKMSDSFERVVSGQVAIVIGRLLISSFATLHCTLQRNTRVLLLHQFAVPECLGSSRVL
jgi:hypothetical protein